MLENFDRITRPDDDPALETKLIANARRGACPPPDLLFAAREGVLPEEAGAEIRAHADRCALCQTLLAALTPESATLTPAQDARIRFLISRTTGPQEFTSNPLPIPAPLPMPRLSRARSIWTAILATAAAALLALGGVLGYRLAHPPTTAAAPPVASKPAPVQFAELHKIAPLPAPEDSAPVTRGASGAIAAPSTAELLPAFRAYNQGDFSKAVTEFLPLVVRYPQADIPLLYLGVSQLELGENADARATLLRAHDFAAPNRRTAATWYLGVSLLRLGDQRRALTAFQSVCDASQSDYAPRACELAAQLEYLR